MWSPAELRNVALRGLTLRNSPSYNVSLIGTEDEGLGNLRIVNGYADGIDPDDARLTRIANCYIDTFSTPFRKIKRGRLRKI